MSDQVYDSRNRATGVPATPHTLCSWEVPKGLTPGQMNRGNYPNMPEHKRRGPFTLGMISTSRALGSVTKPTRQPAHKTPGKKSYSGKSHKKRGNRACIMPMPKKYDFAVHAMMTELGKIRKASAGKPHEYFLRLINSLRSRYPHMQNLITQALHGVHV